MQLSENYSNFDITEVVVKYKVSDTEMYDRLASSLLAPSLLACASVQGNVIGLVSV